MDTELVAAYLAGELDEEGLALLDEALAEGGELVQIFADQVTLDQALRVLLGDAAADRKVVRSVLSVLEAKPVESLKNEFLRAMGPVEEEPLVSCPLPPRKPRTEPKLERPASPPKSAPIRKFPLGRMAAGLAACVAVAAAFLVLRGSEEGPDDGRVFVLAATKAPALKRGVQYRSAHVNAALQAGDILMTGKADEAKIGFSTDPTRITIKGGSEIRLLRGARPKQVELLKGEIEATVAPQADDRIVILTPAGEVRAQDAQLVLAGGGALRLEVRRGSATLRRKSDGASITVGAEQYAVVGEGVEFVARAVGPEKKPAAAEDAPVATLIRAQGEVFFFTGSPADRKPAQVGHRLTAKEGILTEGAGSRAVLAYADDTQLELAGDTVVRKLADPKAKHVLLDQGSLTADVVRQAADRPMTLETPHAGVRVLGTRFLLQAQKEYSRVQVEEGAVRFTRARDQKSVDVRSGYYAVASPEHPLQAIPVPGGERYLEIDLSSGAWSGDGHWVVEGRSVRQRKISRNPDGSPLSPASDMLFKAATERSVLLEATVQVNQVAPDSVRGEGAWGFGLVAEFQNRSVVLRSSQGGPAGSVVEFKDIKPTAYEHRPEGTYRIKLKIDRRPLDRARGQQGQASLLQGKIWQGDREPDGWLIEEELSLEGPLAQVGFQTLRSACTFSGFKVKVLKEESR